jgi:hypothetical protein
MKEQFIKIVELLQGKVNPDDVPILANRIYDIISEDYVEKAKYDEAVRQRDELRRMTNSLILSICAHPDYVSGEEGDEWHDLTSLAEAAIKNTER